jgi:hypothetical protein
MAVRAELRRGSVVGSVADRCLDSYPTCCRRIRDSKAQSNRDAPPNSAGDD